MFLVIQIQQTFVTNPFSIFDTCAKEFSSNRLPTFNSFLLAEEFIIAQQRKIEQQHFLLLGLNILEGILQEIFSQKDSDAFFSASTQITYFAPNAPACNLQYNSRTQSITEADAEADRAFVATPTAPANPSQSTAQPKQPVYQSATPFFSKPEGNRASVAARTTPANPSQPTAQPKQPEHQSAGQFPSKDDLPKDFKLREELINSIKSNDENTCWRDATSLLKFGELEQFACVRLKDDNYYTIYDADALFDWYQTSTKNNKPFLDPVTQKDININNDVFIATRELLENYVNQPAASQDESSHSRPSPQR